jgi:hypothetical protein
VRRLMWMLRIGGGCWFWLFLVLGLTSLFMKVNVATGTIGLAERITRAAVFLVLAVPGLISWILTGRWLAHQPPPPRGFEVTIDESKQPPREI